MWLTSKHTIFIIPLVLMNSWIGATSGVVIKLGVIYQEYYLGDNLFEVSGNSSNNQSEIELLNKQELEKMNFSCKDRCEIQITRLSYWQQRHLNADSIFEASADFNSYLIAKFYYENLRQAVMTALLFPGMFRIIV
jgi:hypothetical protein